MKEQESTGKKLKRTLPRLDSLMYVGTKHVFFTAPLVHRRRLFVKRQCVDGCVEALKETCGQYRCECIVYAFMPDHVHLILRGLDEASDVLRCHQVWKGKTGALLAKECSDTSGVERGGVNTRSVATLGEQGVNTRSVATLGEVDIWQRSYDHVYRSWEYERRALSKTISYILMNPVRGKLAECWQEYAFLGSMIGQWDIRHPYWWEWFCG